MMRLLLAGALALALPALGACGGPPNGLPATVSADDVAGKLDLGWTVAKTATVAYVASCTVMPDMAICSAAAVAIADKALRIGDADVAAARAAILAAGSDQGSLQKAAAIGIAAIQAFTATVTGLGIGEKPPGP